MEDMSIKRSFEITYRAKKDSEKKVIQGYAVVFDSWTDIRDRWGDTWRECISRGAFKESIKNNKVLALYNHDFNNILARKDVNMNLFEDDKGLKFEIDLPNTSQANDLYELIDRGIVNQCSFAGVVKSETWDRDSDCNISSVINEIDLIEITITPIPAYEVTEAEVKRSREIKGENQNQNKESNFDFEEIIRESKRKLKEIRESERELNER